jgi:hypothetical protein
MSAIRRGIASQTSFSPRQVEALLGAEARSASAPEYARLSTRTTLESAWAEIRRLGAARVYQIG